MTPQTGVTVATAYLELNSATSAERFQPSPVAMHQSPYLRFAVMVRPPSFECELKCICSPLKDKKGVRPGGPTPFLLLRFTGAGSCHARAATCSAPRTERKPETPAPRRDR